MRTIALLIFCFFLLANLAYAHPPLAIDIKYDQATKNVTATIHHQASNPKRHFIEKVIIKVNGTVLELKRFSFQTNAREQVAVCAIPRVQAGDMIAIEAYCNKGGRFIQQIKVE